MRYHLLRASSLQWLAAVLATLLVISACRRGAPVLDVTPPNPNASGTITGTVRGPQNGSPIAGRIVHAVNVDTGALTRGSTNDAGGYTFKVEPGRYRVEVTLLPGESVLEQPDVLEIGASDLEVGADFVVGTSRSARPRIRPLRFEDSLGAPSA